LPFASDSPTVTPREAGVSFNASQYFRNVGMEVLSCSGIGSFCPSPCLIHSRVDYGIPVINLGSQRTQRRNSAIVKGSQVRGR